MSSLHATADLLKLFGDPTRVRLMTLLGEQELSVAELVGITQLPQSRISTHLGRLKEAGLVRDRPLGTASFYSLNETSMGKDAGRLWGLLRHQTHDPLLEQDRERLTEADRRRGGSWADSVAGRMERHYSPGRTWEGATRGLLGLARLGDVLDVASGDGALAELIERRARSVTCLDRSARVIRAARQRLSDRPGVQFRIGDMHALPFRDAAFDQVLFMNALTYAENPERAAREAARVLRPGGDLAAVTLKSHRHRDVAATYDHVQLGFEPAELRDLFSSSGFLVHFCEVTSREKRSPNFEIITLHAQRRSYGGSA